MSEEVRSGSRTPQYAWLLVALVTLLVSTGFTRESLAASALRQLVSTGVLVAALFSVGGGGLRIAGLALGVPTLVAGWVRLAAQSPGAAEVELAFFTAFLSLVTVAIFASILRSRRVTTDTILGGVSVYLLVAVAFSCAFGLVELLAPGSLREAGGPVSGSRMGGIGSAALYFSFVTLSTLGYGDVVPTSVAARMLASAEAVLGQLYIAVFIARLVGLHLAQERDA